MGLRQHDTAAADRGSGGDTEATSAVTSEATSQATSKATSGVASLANSLRGKETQDWNVNKENAEECECNDWAIDEAKALKLAFRNANKENAGGLKCKAWARRLARRMEAAQIKEAERRTQQLQRLTEQRTAKHLHQHGEIQLNFDVLVARRLGALGTSRRGMWRVCRLATPASSPN